MATATKPRPRRAKALAPHFYVEHLKNGKTFEPYRFYASVGEHRETIGTPAAPSWSRGARRRFERKFGGCGQQPVESPRGAAILAADLIVILAFKFEP